MKSAEEQLIDRDLTELLSGDAPPDLINQTLARLSEREAVREADVSEVEHLSARTASAPQERGGKNKGRLLTLRALSRLATAACVLIAVGLMTWLLWPQSLPETITASAEATYVVRDDHVQLNQGWLLITDGSPEVRVDDGRVNDVSGRAVVGAGIPQGEALDALADQLGLSAEEREMLKLNKRWLTAGGLALCLFSGQAIFNGETVRSEDLPRPEISEQKVEIPEAEDVEGVRKIFDHVETAELRTHDDEYRWRGWYEVPADRTEEFASLFGDNIRTLPNSYAGYDHTNRVYLTMEDGRVIELSVYEYGNLIDIKLPGWIGYAQFTTTAKLRKDIKPWLDEASKLPVIPRADDYEAIRARLIRSDWIRMTQRTESLNWSGESYNPAVIGELVRELFSDETGYSKSIIFDDTAYVLEFRGRDREFYEIALDKHGAMSIRWPDDTVVAAYSLPETRLKAVQKLLYEQRVLQPSMMRVKRKWTGSDSSIREPGVHIVMDDDAWVTLWAEHMAPELMQTPEVNFESEMVVAVFGGDSVNSRGYFVQEILRASTGWIVRVDETTYQSAAGADDVTPFGIWVFPRNDWSIVVEENVQSLKNERPRWKQIGYRLGEGREPENILDQWYPASTHTGKLGEDHGLEKGVRIVTEGDVLDEITAAIGLDFDAPIDLEKNVVVFAVASAVEGTGNYFFELRGMNASRLVARVIAPTAQSGPNPKWVDIYGLWVLPRPEGELVIETPKYAGINESPTWQETAVQKME